ncbi:hypothetical protein PP459_gp162 [Streptomyces phage Wakanda]|uniref:Uncharacterized protein n=1 Tax=Streptomyces phage Wakanda TaxID=2713267 RepID=A0A6G8R1N0_9CAUD|nr:hypothetical protein PP459_gp162 [Streptomyces phage Wakanda]QIN94071.1 hypothetical protein SEA_WAKANDA_79 [Streptomyces phage Wakanda]
MKITLINKEEGTCSCVGKHIPLPHKLFLVESRGASMTVCPNAMMNLLSLAEQHVKHGGNPPGSVRKHYSEFVHEMYSLLY